MAKETNVNAAPRTLLEYLREHCPRTAERAIEEPEYGDSLAWTAEQMPGVDYAAAEQLDRLLGDMHGCQTEVMAVYADGRLHTAATGPVCGSKYEDWAVRGKDRHYAPRACTTHNQWSGLRRMRASELLRDLAERVGAQREYEQHTRVLIAREQEQAAAQAAEAKSEAGA